METQYIKRTIFTESDCKAKYDGFIHNAYRFVCEKQIMRTDLWKRFVHQFKTAADSSDEGWRGEFWGKMMRGASLVYSYIRDDELYCILKNTVIDLLKCEDENGRISTYSVKKEFSGWDIWCRKYVMLGMEYFLEICKEEELKEKIIKSLCRQGDYLISKIGDESGKISITATSDLWRGLNSSSILEPIVKLYSLTSEKKYLDFAEYIISAGGNQVVNIFDLAYENELYPYQYPTTKAYEMTSCFEGLLEYYKITGNERYKTAVINYADKILESDFTVIGGCGCTGELFDHSTVRQANTNNDYIAQETCVTVTMMKFFSRVYLLTGDPKYIDAFETSLYNAYLGAFNTNDSIDAEMAKNFPECICEPLPFDSYSPLTSGTRGNRIGGKEIMSDNHYYGCCASIGSAGIGLVYKTHIMNFEGGIAVNLFLEGVSELVSPGGNKLTLKTYTDYPVCGDIKFTINLENSEEFEILIRNPYWSQTTKLLVNGESIPTSDGYIRVKREWVSGDVIELKLDMRTQAIYPISYGSQILMNKVIWDHNYVIPTFDREDPLAHKHISLRRGPLMLAQDSRFGYSVDEPIEIVVNENGYVDVFDSDKDIPFDCIANVEVPLTDGTSIMLADYSSVGKLYTDESKMAVWILTK